MRGGGGVRVGGGECAHSNHIQSEAAAVKKNSRASGRREGGGGDENVLPVFAPEAVAVDMDLFSSGKVDSAPRGVTEVLPCSFQFCQTCI